MHLIYKTDNPLLFKKVHGEDALNVKKREGWSVVTPFKFAESILSLRERLGFTQEQMALYLSKLCVVHFTVQTRQYQKWEQGTSLKRFLTVKNLLVLSEVLCVPLGYFTGAEVALPPLWRAGSVLTNATHRVGKEPVVGYDLHLFIVTLEDRVATYQRCVLAKTASAARRHLLHVDPGACISRVDSAEWEEGVVGLCGTRR